MTSGGRIIIDGGQTGSRIRIIGDGDVTDRTAGPIHTDHPVTEQVAALVTRALADVATPVTELAVGVSGLTPQYARSDELLGATAGLGISSVALAHDSVTAYLGADDLRLGVVTAVGTGVVTLAAGPAGTARVDGWGHMFGDAGSAYWIGRAGVDAALRAFDGRGPATALHDTATTDFGPLPELYMALQGDRDRVSKVAGFARRVDAAAVAGDEVARRINGDAATELARSAVTAAQRSGHRPGEECRVSWMGDVLERNDRIRERFVELVGERLPDAQIGPPLGTSLDGVALLDQVPADHPLYGLISRSR